MGLGPQQGMVVTLAWLVIQLGVCAVLIARAGFVLSRSADRLAVAYGWGRGWVGLALLAALKTVHYRGRVSGAMRDAAHGRALAEAGVAQVLNPFDDVADHAAARLAGAIREQEISTGLRARLWPLSWRPPNFRRRPDMQPTALPDWRKNVARR